MFASSARVGLVVLIGIVLVAFLFAFFSNASLQGRTYKINVIFADASGIDKDADVQLAGVRVGKVTLVSLAGEKANVEMVIRKEIRIPADSKFLIQTPALSAMGYIDIVPQKPTQHEAYIQPEQANLVGGRALDIQQSLSKADLLMDQLTGTVGKVNDLLDHTTRLIGDPIIRKSLDQTLANTQTASANAAEISRQLNIALEEDNDQVLALLKQTRKGSTAAIANLTDATASVRDLTVDNKDKFTEIINNMEDTSSALAGITTQTNDLLKNGGVAKNLSQIVANLNATTQKLDAMTANLQTLSGDAGLQGDIKATVHNLRETTDQTAVMVGRLNRLLGVKPAPATATQPATTQPAVAPSTPSPATPLYLPRVDMLQNTTHSHFRADIDAMVPFGQNLVEAAGVYGFGDTNRLNLEAGKVVDASSGAAVRGGLYRSKLAIGADIGLGKQLSVRADLYDPNNLRADIRGILMLNNQTGLVVGADDIGRNPGAIVGIELRR